MNDRQTYRLRAPASGREAIAVVEERRADAALTALRALTVPETRVRRDGAVLRIPAPELVPGDVVLLEPGDRVPADLRLVATAGGEVDETGRPGESQGGAEGAPAGSGGGAGVGGRARGAFTGPFAGTGHERAGALEGVTGLALGRFTKDGDAAADVSEVLVEYARRAGVPAVTDLPFGHVAGNFVLPVGVQARLDADAAVLTILEAAVRAE